jgi:hypothetical protein
LEAVPFRRVTISTNDRSIAVRLMRSLIRKANIGAPAERGRLPISPEPRSMVPIVGVHDTREPNPKRNSPTALLLLLASTAQRVSSLIPISGAIIGCRRFHVRIEQWSGPLLSSRIGHGHTYSAPGLALHLCCFDLTETIVPG